MIKATRWIAVAAVPCALSAQSGNSGAPTTPDTVTAKANCDSKLSHPEASYAPSYALHTLGSADMAHLRNALAAQDWTKVLRVYLGQYQPQLPAWVVHIDAAGKVSQCVIADDHAGSIVRHKRWIWAMVFSELPVPDGETAKKGPAANAEKPSVDTIMANAAANGVKFSEANLRVAKTAVDTTAVRLAAPRLSADQASIGLAEMRAKLAEAKPPAHDSIGMRLARRAFVVQKDPVLLTVITALASTFRFADKQPETKFDDTVRTIDFHQIAADTPSTKAMWVGFGRVGLAEGALVQLALFPRLGEEFLPSAAGKQHLQAIYTNVRSVREHSFEIGVIPGVTWRKQVPSYDANARLTDSRTATNFSTYAAIFWNPRGAWHEFPSNKFPFNKCPFNKFPFKQDSLQRTSWASVFVGTNVLTGSLADEFVAGYAIGHLLSDAGLSFGLSWIKTPEFRGNAVVKPRKPHWFIGVDLRM